MTDRFRTTALFVLQALAGFFLACSASAADLPADFVIDLERLARTKARIEAGDEALRPAVARLKQETAEALRAGPFSVLDKTRVPPSGDKHDYLSLGPYWWPDPAKPDGLPYIRRDGEVNPESEVGTDRGPLSRMASAVETLALHYHLSGDEAAAEHAARLLRVWLLDPATRMNPHLNFGQGIPGRTTGRAEGIIETQCLPGVLDAVRLLRTSPAWTADDQAAMVVWCAAYLDWLRTSEIGRREAAARNNHGTWYDAQVAALAVFVGREDLARQTIEAARRRLAEQIEPVGRQPLELARTKSFGYSLFNLRGWFVLAALGERVGVDLWHYGTADGRSLRKALDFVAPYADPQKRWPYPELKFNRSGLVAIVIPAVAAYGEEPYGKYLDQLPRDEIAANRGNLLYGGRLAAE